MKALMTLLLNSCRRCHSVSTIVRDMFCDIHSKMNDIIEDVQLEACNYYKIITPGQIIPITAMLMSHVEQFLEDVEWMITRMKAELSTCLTRDGKWHFNFEPTSTFIFACKHGVLLCFLNLLYFNIKHNFRWDCSQVSRSSYMCATGHVDHRPSWVCAVCLASWTLLRCHI